MGAVTELVSREEWEQADHIYTMEWTPASVEMKVDGVLRNSASFSSTDATNAWTNTDVFVIVNQAIGGSNGGWDLSPFPYHYWVDYVRYYPYIGPDAQASSPVWNTSAQIVIP